MGILEINAPVKVGATFIIFTQMKINRTESVGVGMFNYFILFIPMLICCKGNEGTKETVEPTPDLKNEVAVIADVPLSTQQKIDTTDPNKIYFCDSLTTINHPSIETTGIVQTIGLQPKGMKISKAKFQLISGNLDFYLIAESQLDGYWGKCIQVKGELLNGWDTSMLDYKYGCQGRIPIVVKSIEEKASKHCNCLSELLANSELSRALRKLDYSDTLSGFIKRTVRPTPDIMMDYSFVLEKPLPHPEDSTIKLPKITILPNINLDLLNKCIENKLKVKTFGWITGGYNESIRFETDSIIPL